MRFEEGHVYHIYNMGNNSTKIFFNKENYLFFLKKIRSEIKPVAEILAFCLMPNHFHLMVQATEKSCKINKSGILRTTRPTARSGQTDMKEGMQVLTRKIGTLLSSYTQAINKQQKTIGSLFRQKTKAKDLREYITYPRTKDDYTKTCFFYIQNNPVVDNLVDKAQDWTYSSYSDFCDLSNGTLCNKNLAFEILGIEKESLHFWINKDFGNIDNIW